MDNDKGIIIIFLKFLSFRNTYWIIDVCNDDMEIPIPPLFSIVTLETLFNLSMS